MGKWIESLNAKDIIDFEALDKNREFRGIFRTLDNDTVCVVEDYLSPAPWLGLPSSKYTYTAVTDFDVIEIGYTKRPISQKKLEKIISKWKFDLNKANYIKYDITSEFERYFGKDGLSGNFGKLFRIRVFDGVTYIEAREQYINQVKLFLLKQNEQKLNENKKRLGIKR